MFNKCCAGLGILATVLFAAPEAAAKHSGFEFGARLAYGRSLGKVQDSANADMVDFVQGQIPLWLDLGYRINPSFFVGAYASYGVGGVGDLTQDICDLTDADCFAASIRFGVEGQFHFLPKGSVDPWFGVGTGFETTGINVKADGDETTFGYGGWEMFMLQGGVDFKLKENIGLGPFVAFTMGQYSSASCDGDGCDNLSEAIDKKAFHQWVLLGVRGEFGPLF